MPLGRIDLVAVVRLEDLGVVLLGLECARRELRQPEQHVDAQAHVGSEHDRQAARDLLELRELRAEWPVVPITIGTSQFATERCIARPTPRPA